VARAAAGRRTVSRVGAEAKPAGDREDPWRPDSPLHIRLATCAVARPFCFVCSTQGRCGKILGEVRELVVMCAHRLRLARTRTEELLLLH
jgi:hypothetical protein